MKKPAIPTFALGGTIIGSESLTTVFGMGTGVAFPIWSPARRRGACRVPPRRGVIWQMGHACEDDRWTERGGAFGTRQYRIETAKLSALSTG